MKNTFIKYMVLACSVTAVFSSCRKDDYEGTQSAEKGTSFVRIIDSKLKSNFFDAFTDIKTTSLFSIRKDAATTAVQAQATSVTLTDLGQTYLNKYNAEKHTSYEIMPTTVYSFADAALTTPFATGVKVNFPAGSDIQEFKVKLDGSKLDPAKKYALAYVITDAEGLKTRSGRDTIIATIGVKNKYDGVYKATGLFVRVGLDQRDINQNKTLSTVDASTVQSTLADLGDNYPILLTVNADNSVTVTFTETAKANLGVPPYTQIGENKYDPATKTYTLHYQYRGGARTTEEKLVRQ